MDKPTSLYLDVLRFSAAMLVFLAHLSWRAISGGFLWRIGGTGHDGVVIFFVLSGYVISAVAAAKEKDLQSYTVSRLARLYSVLIPALLLTLVCDSIGLMHNSAAYDAAHETVPLARLGSAFFFLSTIWHFDFNLLSNDAYWSLPYEFWYYVIFACAAFLRGRWRWIGVGAASLIAGPNILLMFPLWLLGVAVHRHPISMSRNTAWIVFGGTILVVLAILSADSHHMIARASTNAWPPGFSVVDFLTGSAVALNIASVSRLQFRLRAESLIRYCAGFTFALYLFHLPLLHLGAAYLPQTINPIYRGLILLLSVTLFVTIFGTLAERSKRPLRRGLGRLFDTAKVTPLSA